MKLMYVATFIPDTNYTRDLSVYFDKILKKNDKIYLCGKKDDIVKDGKNPKVDYVWRRDPRFFMDILTYVNKIDPDVIHFQHEFKTFGGLITAIMFPFLLFVLKIQGYKTVVTIHGVVSPQQVNFDFLESFNVKPSKLSQILVKTFFHFIYKSILIFADKITVHAPMLKEILGSYLSIFSKKIVVIEHGIREVANSEALRTAGMFKKYPILKNKNIILVFGHFSPRKGYEFLIDAFNKALGRKKNSKWVLALVGDVQPEFAAYWDKILLQIKTLKLENKVIMTGFVDKTGIDEFYRNSSIVLIPAIISFNTSGALSLALAYKKPMLVANVKPLGAEIVQNNFGLVYEKKGKNTLEAQLSKMTGDTKLVNKLKDNLKKIVGRRYWTNIAQEHYDLYESMVS